MDALNVILALINIAVALYQGWREWRSRRQPETHPLELSLRDIAQAIRESGGQS